MMTGIENRGNLKRNISIRENVYQLPLPIPLLGNENWKPLSIFRGVTSTFQEISCHISALRKGHIPHIPHSHDEEELLLIINGEAILLLPDLNAFQGNQQLKLKEGQFVYYPSHFSHTLKAESRDQVTYLMLKWKSGLRNKEKQLTFSSFKISGSTGSNVPNNGFSTRAVFQGRTFYLERLHCHISNLRPKGGYEPHSDNYDVFIYMLEGEVETLGKRARKNDIIFYPAGAPHGMYNPGNGISRYIVFEFHGEKDRMLSRIFKLLAFIFNRITSLDFWKRRFKKNFKLSGFKVDE